MADKQAPPLWLDAVRRFERAIGVPIESAVTSDAYFDALTRLKRAHAQVASVVENVTDDVFRMLNVPAGSDVRKMREQLSRMERRLEAMSKELAKQKEAPRGDGTKAMTEERANQKNASPDDATKATPKERANRKTVRPGDGRRRHPRSARTRRSIAGRRDEGDAQGAREPKGRTAGRRDDVIRAITEP